MPRSITQINVTEELEKMIKETSLIHVLIGLECVCGEIDIAMPEEAKHWQIIARKLKAIAYYAQEKGID